MGTILCEGFCGRGKVLGSFKEQIGLIARILQYILGLRKKNAIEAEGTGMNAN